MALVETYVDPDATGSGTGVDWTNAYTSLNAWEAAEQTDLVSDGDNHTVHLRSSAGGDDTTETILTGWTTDATHLITITQDDFPTDGILDETKYVLHNSATANGYVLSISEDFIDIDGIQIICETVAGDNEDGIGVASTLAGSVLNINRAIIKGISSGTKWSRGITLNDADSTVNISNCTIFGFISGGDSGFMGVLANLGVITVFNTDIYGCYYGINRLSATTVATNCAVGNNTDDFSGTITIDHCCSDDGDGTNAQGPLSGSWANEFTDAANGNFTLVAGGNCIDNGTNTGAPSTDIIGTARPQNVTVDIGAYEYVATSTGIVTPYYYQKLMAG